MVSIKRQTHTYTEVNIYNKYIGQWKQRLGQSAPRCPR